jgi:hypothetical protein
MPLASVSLGGNEGFFCVLTIFVLIEVLNLNPSCLFLIVSAVSYFCP